MLIRSLNFCTNLSLKCFVRSITTSFFQMVKKNTHTEILFGEENDEIEQDDGLPRDYKVMNITMLSKRLDALISKTTSRSTLITEKLIGSKKVRVKNQDEIDIWNSRYEENPEFIQIDRIKVSNITINADGYKIAVKYWKNLIVNDWENQTKLD